MAGIGPMLELRRTERYAVHDAIAHGGMASVHIGVLHGTLGFSRIVAIKRLHTHLTADKRFVAMLIDEARLASRIRYVNVVTTLDILESSGEVFVIMEYVRSASLARLIEHAVARGQMIPLRIAVPILAGALHGLDAAHEATDLDGTPLGIVHRDVSPANILVGVAGIPRVIDFGVAHALGQADRTLAGEFKGKLAYAAPEQVAEPATTSRQTDVFAAGIVLWELLTGKRLFRAPTDMETLRNVMACSIPSPLEIFATSEPMRAAHSASDIAALAPIALRALARNPADRYATAADMATALEAAITGASPHERGAWVQDVASTDLLAQQAIVQRVEERIAREVVERELDTTVAGRPGLASQPSPAPRADHAGVRQRGNISGRALAAITCAAFAGAAAGAAIAQRLFAGS